MIKEIKKGLIALLCCSASFVLLMGIIFIIQFVNYQAPPVPDPELDYPGVKQGLGVVIANLRNDPAYEGQRLGVDDFSVGNPIFVYDYKPWGFRVSRCSYPLFIDGTVVASAEQVGGPHNFSSGVYASTPHLNDYISQEIAIVFDEDGVYIYDGTEFHFLYPLDHTISSRGNIEDAKKLSTHAEKLVLSELTPVASFEKQP